MVTLVLVVGYGWLRLIADTRAPGALRALVAPAILGIVLSGSFWMVALLGYVNVRFLDPVVVGQAVIFSSAGVAGGSSCGRFGARETGVDPESEARRAFADPRFVERDPAH